MKNEQLKYDVSFAVSKLLSAKFWMRKESDFFYFGKRTGDINVMLLGRHKTGINIYQVDDFKDDLDIINGPVPFDEFVNNGFKFTQPKTEMDTLQKDLIIFRMVGHNDFKYQYQLFKDGKPTNNVLTDKDYQFGKVDVDPSDNSMTLTMVEKASEVRFKELESENVFIVPVTIKSN